MGSYDSRHVTLDPGLTAIALRGLHEREGHYPFLNRFATHRWLPRRRGARRGRGSVWLRALRGLRHAHRGPSVTIA